MKSNGNPAASVEFIIIGDGKTLWQSGVMRAGNAAKQCQVPLAGVKSLVLEVENSGDGIDFDHADWADAKFEAAVGARLAAVAGSDLPATPYILTPVAPATPRLNGPNVFGVRPGSPFLYTIPATGRHPMAFLAGNLPPGLKLDAATGQITGSLTSPGETIVTLRAKNALGAAEKKFRIVCGGHRAHPADGLEQLELFRRRSHAGARQGGGGRHGQQRPHQPRLDLHQCG